MQKAGSSSYLATNQDTTSAVITYEVNPSVWKEITPTTENPDISSPVSLTITKDGETDPVVSVPLDLPTEAAQTYSWNGKNPTEDEYVTPGVYQVTITVVRDPNADAPETVATATHQITVFKIDFVFVTSSNAEIAPGDVTFTADVFHRFDEVNDLNDVIQAGGEDLIRCLADIKPDSLDATYNSLINWEIEDDPDVAGDSGDPPDVDADPQTTPQDNEPRGGANGIVRVIARALPMIDVDADPRPHRVRMRIPGRDHHLNYRIQTNFVLTDGTKTYPTVSEWKAIRQDDRDYIRQQYMDMDTLTFRRPPRETQRIDNRDRGLVTMGTYDDPGNITFNDLSCNGLGYCLNHVYHWDNTVAAVFQLIRDEHNAATVPNEEDNAQITNPYTGGIRVTSTFRCPRWHVTQADSRASWHIRGDAFDFNQRADIGTVEDGSDWTRAQRNWAVALSAVREMVPQDDILLYPQRGNPEDFGWLTDTDTNPNYNDDYPNRLSVPPGWNTYRQGHISTNDHPDEVNRQ